MAETFVELDGRKIWCGVIGEPTARPALLCVPGGPGVAHHYLTPLAALADQRQVVFYDALGSGRSERPPLTWTADVYEREIDAVIRGLGLHQFHVFSHSAGGFAAMPFAARKPPGLRALILANAVANSPGHMMHLRHLLEKMNIAGHSLARLEQCERDPRKRDVWYVQLASSFMAKYSCRLRPLPANLIEATRNTNDLALQALKGGWILYTGSLANWDFRPRLHEIEAPTLFTHGHFDILSAEALDEMRGIPNLETQSFAHSSHMPHLEEPEANCARVAAFLAQHD